jgi:hypothetical protein
LISETYKFIGLWFVCLDYHVTAKASETRDKITMEENEKDDAGDALLLLGAAGFTGADEAVGGLTCSA